MFVTEATPLNYSGEMAQFHDDLFVSHNTCDWCALSLPQVSLLINPVLRITESFGVNLAGQYFKPFHDTW